jgi:site-specific recombinase XerC
VEITPWFALTSKAGLPLTKIGRTAFGSSTIITAPPADGSTANQDHRSLLKTMLPAEKLILNRLAGTFNGLVRDYTLSVEFEETLAPSTRSEYRRMLTKAEAEFWNMPLAALDDQRVRKDFLDWREKVSRTPGGREADNRLSAISAMLTWAVDRGGISTNPLRGFKRLYHADRSEIIWLPEHIAQFMKVAPIEIQRALILGLHLGQREGDLLRLPWSAYDGVRISLRQGKVVVVASSARSSKFPVPSPYAVCLMAWNASRR